MSTPPISRRAVVKAALSVAACAACPALVRGGLVPTRVAGRFTLALAAYPVLRSPNGSVVVEVPGGQEDARALVVTNTGPNTFAALSAVCTHNGCVVRPYDAGTDRIVCLCHGSAFGVDGAVRRGPAGSPLTRYAATYDASSDAVFVEVPSLVGVGDGGAPATGIALDLPAPHPVSGQATLRYRLPAAAAVRLAVYDTLGRCVAVLAEGPRAPGAHAAPWDARALAPGVYVARLEADGTTTARTVTVAR